MYNRIALLVSVRYSYLLGQQANFETRGVARAKQRFRDEVLIHKFNQIKDLGEKPKKAEVLYEIRRARKLLAGHGTFLFYFTGHALFLDSGIVPDEPVDQAMVCCDGYLFDDELRREFKQFKPSTRIITMMDACYSETLVEWYPSDNITNFPRVINYAAAAQGLKAGADSNGGYMTQHLVDLLANGRVHDYSYAQLAGHLQQRLAPQPFRYNFTPSVSNYLRNKKLFD